MVCAAHRLQNAIKDALSSSGRLLENLLARARNIVTHFKKSAVDADALQVTMKEMELKTKKLIQDCPTRWNSAFFMLQRLVELEIPVGIVLRKSKLTQLELSPQEWAAADSLIAILADLEEVNRTLCGETCVTLSYVLPLMFGLVNKTLVDKADDRAPIPGVKRNLRQSISKRFELINLTPDRLDLQAAALDPRFRHLPFLNLRQTTNLQSSLTAKASAILEGRRHAMDIEPPPAKVTVRGGSLLDSILDSFDGDDEEGGDHPASQVKAYLAEKPVARSNDPLQWWAINGDRFPELAVLARQIFTVPATSAPAERVFSTSGLVVDPKRASMSTEMVDALVFLHRNPPLFNEPKLLPERTPVPLVVVQDGDDSEEEEPEFPDV